MSLEAYLFAIKVAQELGQMKQIETDRNRPKENKGAHTLFFWARAWRRCNRMGPRNGECLTASRHYSTNEHQAVHGCSSLNRMQMACLRSRSCPLLCMHSWLNGREDNDLQAAVVAIKLQGHNHKPSGGCAAAEDVHVAQAAAEDVHDAQEGSNWSSRHFRRAADVVAFTVTVNEVAELQAA
jgi:hypothetical protein